MSPNLTRLNFERLVMRNCEKKREKEIDDSQVIAQPGMDIHVNVN